MGEAYPDLAANRAFILQVAGSEEERFVSTFQHGMTLFEEEVGRAKASGSATFPGAAAFRLHDTFGFQQQLTEELAEQEGLALDMGEFDRADGGAAPPRAGVARRRARRAARWPRSPRPRGRASRSPTST